MNHEYDEVLTFIGALISIMGAGLIMFLGYLRANANRVENELKGEMTRIRDRYHEDRDKLTEVDSKNELLGYRIEALEGKVKRYIWLLKNALSINGSLDSRDIMIEDEDKNKSQ